MLLYDTVVDQASGGLVVWSLYDLTCLCWLFSGYSSFLLLSLNLDVTLTVDTKLSAGVFALIVSVTL